ncbi:hypothetical protein J7E96_11725 [Streptomyces sp. ISL-96]|uniref:hypothetical protein n=1 Tax=Streptomyces sp. ISL-96 TaxID=2819191 RepID=UPI001BEB18CF|nr:hypothetical protein [Streptomyces sp. ISL-96]MBT2489179.1 hypothetical protein [Streptomyces sp. ISL-96]
MSTLADRFVPHPHFASAHEAVIPAPAEAVWAAIQDFDRTGGFKNVRAVRALVAVRRLLGRLRNRGGTHEDMPTLSVPLAEDPPREVVHGIVGQWWTMGGAANRTDVVGAEAFLAFAEPNHAKAVFVLKLTQSPDGRRTRVVTETRVVCTDPEARRAMGRYWLVIRPFSGLTRRLMLGELRKRATA